mmetsp:Transcript_59810/g.67745  ORF Transcript_59810/g.67745 Transcript_59810/m.67745 type:complete len:81 (-) Transcript_59810:262-504(-)
MLLHELRRTILKFTTDTLLLPKKELETVLSCFFIVFRCEVKFILKKRVRIFWNFIFHSALLLLSHSSNQLINQDTVDVHL